MKAEHRHELKTNDLSKALMTFPDYVKEYGGRAALGLAIVILIIVLIFQHINKGKLLAAQSIENLAYARSQVDRLQATDNQGRPLLLPVEAEYIRKTLATIKEESKDKQILAEVLVTQGDYAWALLNFPVLPGAATQPSLRPDKDKPELLADAKSAYQAVLDQYPDQTLSVVSARFGLAAVAEQSRNFDEAQTQYQAIKSIKNVDPTFTRLADIKIKRLEDLRKPILLGQVPTTPDISAILEELKRSATTTPTTSTSAPTTTTPTATTTPTTKPLVPATSPTTKPTTKPN